MTTTQTAYATPTHDLHPLAGRAMSGAEALVQVLAESCLSPSPARRGGLGWGASRPHPVGKGCSHPPITRNPS